MWFDEAWNKKEERPGEFISAEKRNTNSTDHVIVMTLLHTAVHSKIVSMHQWPSEREKERGRKRQNKMWSPNITFKLPHIIKITLHKFRNLFYCLNTGQTALWCRLWFRHQSEWRRCNERIAFYRHFTYIHVIIQNKFRLHNHCRKVNIARTTCISRWFYLILQWISLAKNGRHAFGCDREELHFITYFYTHTHLFSHIIARNIRTKGNRFKWNSKCYQPKLIWLNDDDDDDDGFWCVSGKNSDWKMQIIKRCINRKKSIQLRT